MKKDHLYPLYSILLLFVAAPVLAMLAAPWVYRLLQHFVAEDSFLDAPFYRVTSRLALLMVILLMPLACRLSGFKTRADYGLAKCSNRKLLFCFGLGLGAASMLAAYLPGALLGVYAWDGTGKTVSHHLFYVIKILVGGLAVGIFEEILFRGFIFSALRKSLGVVAGIVIASFLFSIVHFMRPLDPSVTTAWNSGFLLTGHLFARAGEAFLQESCTLFCMGLVLCTLYQWLKSVYLLIGLHAGWVWVMMFFRHFTDNQKTMTWLYGTSDWISRSWMGSVLSIVFLAAVLLTRNRWQQLAETPHN